VIARLLADEHHSGVAPAVAEDGLRSDLPQLAAAAAGRGRPERGQAQPFRQEVGGGAVPRRSCHNIRYSLDRGIRDRNAPEML
jgi:hypothetical protein